MLFGDWPGCRGLPAGGAVAGGFGLSLLTVPQKDRVQGCFGFRGLRVLGPRVSGSGCSRC